MRTQTQTYLDLIERCFFFLFLIIHQMLKCFASRRCRVWMQFGAFLCRVYMLSRFLSGFFPSAPAASHSTKACIGLGSLITVGVNVSVNGCLSFCVSSGTHWRSVQSVLCLCSVTLNWISRKKGWMGEWKLWQLGNKEKNLSNYQTSKKKILFLKTLSFTFLQNTGLE